VSPPKESRFEELRVESAAEARLHANRSSDAARQNSSGVKSVQSDRRHLMTRPRSSESSSVYEMCVERMGGGVRQWWEGRCVQWQAGT